MTENKGWFSKLKSGLQKTSEKISNQLHAVFHHKKISDDTLDELEEILILGDLGSKTSKYIVDQVRKQKYEKEITFSEIKELISNIIVDILKPFAKEISIVNKPHVILMCGVNGNGKTTTTGKLASYYKNLGKKVLVAACDTFRAAAVEQLIEWSKRANVDIITGTENQDPASLAYQAYQKSIGENYDVLIIDTAGRLHNKNNLMEELKKITTVLKKLEESAPHDNILVLDATTGQNAFKQVEIFNQIINLSGLIITKLDGTSKGGVVVGLAKEFSVPIYAIGVGEKIDDLQPFTPEDFANNILSTEKELN